MLLGIFQGISYFLQIIEYGMLLYCVLGWFLSPYNKAMQLLGRIFDPILRPIRNKLFTMFPRLPLDLSPLVVYLLIAILQQLLWTVYRWLV